MSKWQFTQPAAIALYAGVGFTYGAIRKSILLNDAVTHQGDEYDSARRERVYYSRPVLFTEKVGIVGLHSLINAYAFPVYAHMDLVAFEAQARGIELERRCEKQTGECSANIACDNVQQGATTRYPYIYEHIFT